ncbi:TRAP transporter substrate-binding protein [Alginatibacterium sediminis]|uniref:TRAP transporter substrate-binding protein n=1 Tax=Alginatibacterium sediminis TaxID=2164068 RepID=A0A420EB23_9ALTE|nr:TRAP transporter substrate-binding protein [Alginatibacterium sediminis]RKF17880.1 TRAP transporter substrate-binding protein [Alginatibacterium sediminis]
MNVKHLLLATLVAGMASSTAVYAKTIKLSHILPTEHPVHQSLEWFAEETSGEIKDRIKVYPNGTLGSETTSMQMVQNGTIGLTKVSAALLESFSESYKILSLPYLYRDLDHYYSVVNGPIGKEILESSRDKGFIGLAFMDAGARSFYTDKPIVTPADLAGMKIRVQNSPLAIDIIKSLGATPVPLPYGELYSALQQGVVDGAENNIPSYYSSRHFEVKKFYSYDRHTMVPDVLVVSTDVWNGFTDEERSKIRNVIMKTNDVQKKNWSDYVSKAKVDLAAKGVTFVESDTPTFQAAVTPVYDKFKAEYPQFGDMLIDIQNTK